MRPGWARCAQVLAVVAALVGSLVLTSAPGGAAPSDDGDSRYIVVLHDWANPDRVAADHARSDGAKVDLIYRHALRGYAGTLSARAAANVARDPRVAFVEADQLVEAFGEVPFGIDRSEVDKKLALTDASAVSYATNVLTDVAILDTGIDASHPDLNVAGGVNCSGGGPFNNSCSSTGWEDGNGHGTHVAGTVAAIDHADALGVVGLVPDASLWAVKVLSDSGSGYMSWIVAGLDWITGRNNNATTADDVEVANMSLGCKCISSTLDNAINRTGDSGAVVVVAAGNSNADTKDYSPANHPKVITVAALADFDGKAGGAGAATCRTDQDDTRADFSNFGDAVDIAAPGVCIRSTVPGGGYDTYSGTSMATPHVAGASALFIAEKNTAKTSNRWSNVLTGLQGSGWSVPASDACGYDTEGKKTGRLLLLAACDTATGGGGGGTDPAPSGAVVTTPSGETGYSQTGKNGKDLNVTVTLVDSANNNAPIQGASVSILLTNDSGGSWSGSGTTNSNGEVAFKLRNASDGTYTTEVTTVSPSSLGWDGVTPSNAYTKAATSSGKGNNTAARAELVAA